MNLPDIFNLLVPNVWTLISQLCATAVLFFLMYKLAYKPVRKILDTRSEYEQARITEAEKLQKDNEETAARAKDIITEANRSAEDIIRDARREADTLKKDIIQEGEKQSAQLLENAKQDMQLQHDRMMVEMHDEIVDVALSAAEKMLNAKLDAESDKEKINEFVKEVTGK